MKYLEFMGPIIRFHREQKEVDVGTLCILTGILKPQYMAIEEGHKEVLLNTWKRICDAVHLDFIHLFKDLETYDQLYDLFLHALLYDDIEEQHHLIEQIERSNIKCSIMLPKFILLKFIYSVINEEKESQRQARYIHYLTYFKFAFSIEEQCLYYDYLGYHYQKQQQYDKAEENYLKADQLPTLKHKDLVHYHMGMLKCKLNEPIIALYLFQAAYKGFESSWNVNRLLYTKGSLGICYSRMGELMLAQQQMKETLQLAKQYHNSYVICNTYDNLAFNCFKMNAYEDCVENAQQAVQRGSSYVYLYYYLIYSYLRLQQTEKAEYWIAKSAHLKPGSIEESLVQYATKMVRKEEYMEYLISVCTRVIASDQHELKKLLLDDLIDLYHEREQFENECICLRELLKLSNFHR